MSELETTKDLEGRDEKTGRFVKGNKVASRNKGKRHKINQALLDHAIKRGEDGLYHFEAMAELAEKARKVSNLELELKAETQYGNWVHAVNNAFVESEDDIDLSDEQLKSEILAVLGGGSEIVTDDDQEQE